MNGHLLWNVLGNIHLRPDTRNTHVRSIWFYRYSALTAESEKQNVDPFQTMSLATKTDQIQMLLDSISKFFTEL